MLASSIALGTIAGIVFGGKWRGLRELRLEWLPLTIVALIVRILGLIFPLPLAVYLTAIVVIAAVALRNFRLPGAVLIGVGSMLNALVITLNGGMPVDAAAAAAVSAAPILNDRLHTTLDAGTQLPWLADILPLPIFRNVYSAGDVLIAAGGFWVPFGLLRAK